MVLEEGYTQSSTESKIGQECVCGQFIFNTHSLMGRGKSFQQTAGTAVSTQRQNGPDLIVKAEAAKPWEGKVERSPVSWGRRRALRTQKAALTKKSYRTCSHSKLSSERHLESLEALEWERILAVHTADREDLFQHMGNADHKKNYVGCLKRSFTLSN